MLLLTYILCGRWTTSYAVSPNNAYVLLVTQSNGPFSPFIIPVYKQKEQGQKQSVPGPTAPKKTRMVFTDAQRRTLRAIFKETPRPSKEMQAAIAQQLGLEISTVANFFMNARRRSRDKWQDENGQNYHGSADQDNNSCSDTDWLSPTPPPIHQLLTHAPCEFWLDSLKNGARRIANRSAVLPCDSVQRPTRDKRRETHRHNVFKYDKLSIIF